MLRFIQRITVLLMGLALAGCGSGSGGTALTSFTVGGTVSGLAAGTLVLQNNGGNNLSITANGSFTFSNPVVQGSSLNVTVLTQPSGQFCSVTGGTGSVTSNISNVSVSCASSCNPGSGADINISGKITFDRVGHQLNGGLDYTNIMLPPVRGAVVEAMCNATIVVATATDAFGDYSLNIPGGTSNLIVRVKAQMLKTGTPSWNFQVRDNTSRGALYSLTSAALPALTVNSILDLHAPSGWGGVSYTTTRAAGPFAILDSVYDAFNKVLVTNPSAVFPALNLNWSINNVPSPGNTALGQIKNSHYNRTEIFILGKAGTDTDEYDGHIVIHEWAHYFEDKFSRSDSIGGSHGVSDVLDIRLAFGEGFGNAYSAMASGDPIYADASGTQQAGGFTLNMEDNCTGGPSTRRGWYSECSVMSILYDLYDANNSEGADTLTMGFSPLYSVLVNEQKNTPAMTSIFSLDRKSVV